MAMTQEDAYATLEPEDSLLSTARRRFMLALDHSRDWRRMARDDFAMYAGDQWSDEDMTHLMDQDRTPVVFNRVAPIIDAVHGTEINNKQETRFSPREMGDVRVNEILTNAAKWARDKCDADDEETDAFRDCLICGMGWVETRLDLDSNPDGEIVMNRVDPLEMYGDPSGRKRNLDDAGWLFRVRDVIGEDIDAMWPGKRKELSAGGGGWGDDDDMDERAPHMADEAWRYASDTSGGRQLKEQRYRLVEYQWLERVPFYRMADPQTGNVVELNANKFRKLSKAMAGVGAEPVQGRDYVRVTLRRAKRAFFVGPVTLETGDCPYDKGFTYRCMTGKRDRNKNYWYGIVRALNDPQRWANKFFCQILHIVNSNAKGGLLAEQNAFVDARKAEEDWAKADSLIFLREGALTNGRVQERTMGNYPVGIDRMMQFAIGSFREISGVNLEMLGMADRDQPGVLEYQRKEAGLTILADMFAGLRRYRKEQGRVLLHFILTYISDGRLIRIEGEAGAKYVPLVRQADVEYDVIVDQAPSSPNQKDKAWAVLVNLIPQLAKMNILPPPEVIDYLPLPATLTEAWKQQVLEAKQDPMNEQAKQLQLREQAATVMKLEAEAAAKMAQAKQSDPAAELNLERMKMEADIGLQQQKLQAEMALKQAELDADMAMKQQEMAFKQQEMGLKVEQAQFDAALKREQMVNDADIKREGQKLNAEAKAKPAVALQMPDSEKVADALKEVVRVVGQQQKATENMQQAMTALADRLSKPKRIVRDDKGRAIGVAVDGETMRKIVRDGKGRALGVE